MKLALTIDAAPEEHIEILAPAPDCRFRFEDGAERSAQVETPEPGVYSVLMDGRVYEARAEETPIGALVVVVEGHRFEIEVRDPRRLRRRSGAAGHAGVHTVSAPMPGKVVRVLAAVGDEVRPGQGLLVVEAMKMQNEIKTPRAGTILSLAAQPGSTVSAGDVLATIG
jgi:biotin carboxyl carrier protein